MTGREKAYFAFRGASALVFLLAITVIPHGAPAVIACIVAGAGGILSCIGVNAGGPGERAGQRVEQGLYDRTRAPQGDWPPFPEDKVIEHPR
jgi:uncharacterized membrane protein SpoIIM required for sporulation